MPKPTFLIALLLCATSALAEPLLAPLPVPLKSRMPVPEMPVNAWLLADFESGWVIDSVNADARIEPASLTKLMTGYLVFDALSRNAIALDDLVYVSKKAWQTGGSRMFIRVDTRVSVADLLRGLIVQSGNDAAVALAEHLGGSEAGFAAQMNHTAAQLGMRNTNFVNSSGLPHPEHYSSARDMSILTLALIRRFPDHYRIYSEKEFTYNGITQQNRNLLLARDPSVDGIKTGYTRKAGYCLIGTANRNGMRLIATVIGSQSAKIRADQVYALLQYGYANYESVLVYPAGKEVDVLPLWMGLEREARVKINDALGILYPKGGKGKLSGEIKLPHSLDAPLSVDDEVGKAEIKFDGEVVRVMPLYPAEDYAAGEWWSRVVDYFRRMVFVLGF